MKVNKVKIEEFYGIETVKRPLVRETGGWVGCLLDLVSNGSIREQMMVLSDETIFLFDALSCVTG